jgi:hypothetical protein
MINLKTILEVSNITGPVRYSTKFGGYDWSVKFDVNKNPTKVGVRMQFYPKDGSQLDGAKLNDVGNKLAAYLQKKFSNHDIIIDRDKDFEDKLSAIGFIVPLDSLSQWVMSDLIGGKTETVDDKPLDNDASSEESI